MCILYKHLGIEVMLIKMLLISTQFCICVILQKWTSCTSNFDQGVETLALSLFYFNKRNISNWLVNNSIPVPPTRHYSFSVIHVFIIFSIFL